MKILVVNDSTGMRNLVKRAVRSSNSQQHQFDEATNGADALKLILSAPPDLVICDWYMPEMSGLALLRAVRGNGSHVKFGVITADDSNEVSRTAHEAGADFVIHKPFTPEKFSAALKAL